MADNEPEESWPVKGIVAENQSKKQYKIEWEGIDPETNEPWRPTWEPYECVSSQLRSEWEAKKRMREERDLRKEHKRKLRALDIQQQKLERGRFPAWEPERDSSRSASPQNSHQQPRSASSDESAPLRSPKKPVPASMSPQRDTSPPLVPTRKRKRISQPDSDPSYRPTQTTHTQSTENTRDTLYSSNISAASVEALKSTQEQLAAQKNRRKSAPSGDAASATAHGEARRRSLPALSQDVEEDVAWPDTRLVAEDPRATKKKLRVGAPIANGRDIPVKAKRRKRNNHSPVDYRLPEAEEAELSPPVEEDEDEEQPTADDQQEPRHESDMDGDIADEPDIGIEDGPFPNHEQEAESEEAVDEDSPPILQSLLRRGASSSEDERGRVVVSSASRKRKQISAPELPESLRYNGASRSEEVITRGEDAEGISRQTRRISRGYGSDSGHQSEEAELPPPSAAKQKGAQKKAKRLKKAGSRSDPDRTHGGVAQALSEQAALPKFRRRRADSVEADEPVNLREGVSRRSYDDTGDLGPDGWPIGRPTTSQEAEDSTHIVPDSQSLARSPAQPAAPFEDYVPYNVEVPPAPVDEAYDPRHARMTSAGPLRKAARRSAGPPGSRLVSANVEKPLKKVRPPEPEVFKPYLPAHSPGHDTIHQFSSQDARPQGIDGTHEAVREVIERSVASRRAGPRAEIAPASASPRTGPSSVQEQELAADNDIDMAYNEFNNVMDQYLMESTGATGAAGELEELGIGYSSGMGSVPKDPPDRAASPISQHASISEEADSGALPQEKEQRQKAQPAPPTVVDRKITNKELGKLIKASGLPTDTKDELAILLEAPDYYKSCGRALTSNTQWSFKLGQIPEEGVEGELMLLVSMEEPSWVLQEHRAAQTPEDYDLDDSAALAKLRTEIAGLKARSAAQQATIEDQNLQIARAKAETMDIQALYGRAIVAIERHETEKAALRLQIAELKAQLSTGLAQIQLIETAAKDKLRSEYERIQKELQMALEMARLTGDHVIRAKAARADELERMEKERLMNQRKMMEAARGREEARRQAEAVSIAQHQQQQEIARNAFVNAKMGDASSSDDQNFQAGSSGSSSDAETDSDDDDEQPVPTASEQLAAVAQAGIALLPPGADAVHLTVPIAAAIEEGVIPGGLAAISPAMSPLPSNAAAAADYEQQEPAIPVAANATNVLESAALLAAAAAAEDTSGETTEQTTTITSHSNPTDSQKLDPLNTSSENIVEILVMDSEELPSKKAYMCKWDAGNVEPCSFRCASRQALYLHLEAVHASDAEAPFADENTGMLLPP